MDSKKFVWEKEYELIQDFAVDCEIMQEYGLNVESFEITPGGYLVMTDQGLKFFGREERSSTIYFIYSAQEHLKKNGFNHFFPLLVNKNNLPFVKKGEFAYYLTEWEEGERINCKEEKSLYLLGQELGNFHLSSSGFVPHPKSRVRADYHIWISRLEDRLQEMQTTGEIGQSKGEKDDFDKIYLEWLPFFYAKGETVLELLKGSNYWDIVDAEERRQGFCHHECTVDKLVTVGKRVMFTNFSQSRFDNKAYDLASVLLSVGEESGWDEAVIAPIIEGYRDSYRFLDGEEIIIYCWATFPRDFYSIGKRYYGDKLDLPLEYYLLSLQKAVDERTTLEEYFNSFLRNFAK